jgi:hypothetical protein
MRGMRWWIGWLVLPLAALLACGSSSTPENPGAPNTTALVVDSGPKGGPGYTNGAFATVTLCVPGTTTCKTIDHLLVDTGSMGVRVLESLLKLPVPLPPVVSDAGNPMAECTSFVDGTAWGPLKLADVKIGGELASNIPIQAIGDELTFALPFTCTGTPINTLDDLGANGILGVGGLPQDCGPSCTVALNNPGLYYECTSSTSCTPAAVPLAKQVPNPVAMFPVDNNGVIIQLPGISSTGAPSVHGVLVFGIDTQTNNGLGAAKVIPSIGQGFVTTTFPAGSDKSNYVSILDSGSNAFYILDATTSGIPQCTTTGLTDFYCPPSMLNLAATISGGGESEAIDFQVASAAVLSKGRNYAFDDLAGPMPGYPFNSSNPSIIWGLPFYFGRSVYTAIEGQPTTAGPGPYFAF